MRYCQKVEMRFPPALPRSSDQFSFSTKHRSGVPCITTGSAGDGEQTRGIGTGARCVTVALPPRVTRFGPSKDRSLRGALYNPNPTIIRLENPASFCGS
jgi:hypothetical protein